MTNRPWPMHQFNILVPSELIEEIKSTAEKKDISMGECARRAMKLYLKREKRKTEQPKMENLPIYEKMQIMMGYRVSCEDIAKILDISKDEAYPIMLEILKSDDY